MLILVVFACVWLAATRLAAGWSPRPPLLDTVLTMTATNCAIIAMALLWFERQSGLPVALLHGALAGAAMGAVLPSFAALRDRLDSADVPVAFRGAPIVLVTAGLAALALLGFRGLGGQ